MSTLVSQYKCGDGLIKKLRSVSASIIRKIFPEDSDTEICETQPQQLVEILLPIKMLLLETNAMGVSGEGLRRSTSECIPWGGQRAASPRMKIHSDQKLKWQLKKKEEAGGEWQLVTAGDLRWGSERESSRDQEEPWHKVTGTDLGASDGLTATVTDWHGTEKHQPQGWGGRATVFIRTNNTISRTGRAPADGVCPWALGQTCYVIPPSRLLLLPNWSLFSRSALFRKILKAII